MTLVLEISPEAEARIRMNATVRGQDVAEYITTLTENDQVIDLSEFEDQADFDDSVAGIREGLADLEAGRTYSLEETFAFLEKDKAEWRQEQAARTSGKAFAPAASSGNSMRGNGEQSPIWAIRVNRKARSDIAAAWRHFAGTAGEEIADAWRLRLDVEIAKLAQFPAM